MTPVIQLRLPERPVASMHMFRTGHAPMSTTRLLSGYNGDEEGQYVQGRELLRLHQETSLPDSTMDHEPGLKDLMAEMEQQDRIVKHLWRGGGGSGGVGGVASPQGSTQVQVGGRKRRHVSFSASLELTHNQQGALFSDDEDSDCEDRDDEMDDDDDWDSTSSREKPLIRARFGVLRMPEEIRVIVPFSPHLRVPRSKRSRASTASTASTVTTASPTLRMGTTAATIPMRCSRTQE